MKYLIADLVTEFEPKHSNLITLAKPFEYFGDRKSDISISLSDEYINSMLKRMVSGTSIGAAEEFSYAGKFCKSIIKFNAMLIHSSAIEYNGKAYLFSADSGVGKSTHTALWRKAFGNDVKMINDDKPVVRIIDGKAVAYGTPFDGGSGIANNISAPEDFRRQHHSPWPRHSRICKTLSLLFPPDEKCLPPVGSLLPKHVPAADSRDIHSEDIHLIPHCPSQVSAETESDSVTLPAIAPVLYYILIPLKYAPASKMIGRSKEERPIFIFLCNTISS